MNDFTSSSVNMYYAVGELGRYPLSISVKVRMITFWANVINCNTSKLTGILYLLASRNHNLNSIRSPWISFIKGILDECGLCNMCYG